MTMFMREEDHKGALIIWLYVRHENGAVECLGKYLSPVHWDIC